MSNAPRHNDPPGRGSSCRSRYPARHCLRHHARRCPLGSGVRDVPAVYGGVSESGGHHYRPATVRFYVDADVLGLAKILVQVRADVTYPGDPGGDLFKRRREACPITILPLKVPLKMISLRLPSRMINRDRTGIRLLGQEHNQRPGLPIHRLLRVITLRLGPRWMRSADQPDWSGPAGPQFLRGASCGEWATGQGLASGLAAWRSGGRTGSISSPAWRPGEPGEAVGETRPGPDAATRRSQVPAAWRTLSGTRGLDLAGHPVLEAGGP